MSAPLPLIAAPRRRDAVLAWRDGRPIAVGRYLADVAAAAERLPEHGPMLNLCTDRYAFAVGFGAALARGHVSLLPPNALDDTLGRLRQAYPAFYVADEASLGLDAARPGADGDAAIPAPNADRPAACLLTSGSTGMPQPHLRAWGPIVECIRAEAERLAQLLGRPSIEGLNLVATVPPQHSYGFESSVLLALIGGAALDAGRPFYPADIVEALARLPRPRALVTTPYHLKTLLRAGLALPPTDLVLSATAPLSPQLALQSERGFGGALVEIYGCTECGQVATRRTVETDLWQPFGTLRVGVETVPGDDGEPQERFYAHGGHVPEPTPLADVLQLADGARFRLLGRTADLIRVAGKRSSLAHLNHHLNSIEGVLDGACWLPPEVEDGVVRPIAFVVAPTLTSAEIIAALRTRLEAVFVPRRVIRLDALPREATGKLTAQTLARLAQEAAS